MGLLLVTFRLGFFGTKFHFTVPVEENGASESGTAESTLFELFLCQLLFQQLSAYRIRDNDFDFIDVNPSPSQLIFTLHVSNMNSFFSFLII